MTKAAPYIIQHIQLQKHWDNIDISPNQESGYYLVFWWENIPLGDLFLEKGEQFSAETLAEKIKRSIEPALGFYATYRNQQVNKINSTTNAPDTFLNMQAMISNILNNFPGIYLPQKTNISVIICTRNRCSFLQKTLDAFLQQKCQPAEIIVVDNAPSDDATKNLVAQYNNVTYVLEPKAGLSFARNTGIGQAKSPIIAWVDDDVVLHPLWLYRVWETFQTSDVTAMTGLVIASALETESQQIFEKYWTFNRGYQDKFFDQSYFENNLGTGPRVWEIGAGANMAFRTSLFKEVGLFDERLGAGASGCSEDSEFWYRILNKGYKIHYNPRAVVFHEHRKEITALKKQIYSYMRGFTAAALIQQKQNKKAGYHKILYKHLPKLYAYHLLKGFPNYHFRYATLWQEIQGVLAGVIYYQKHRSRPANTN